MKIPQLQMESTFAQIAIQKTDARLEMRQKLPQVHIEQPKAEVRIRTTPSKLTIDQSQAFAESNLMSILKRNDQFAQEGIQKLQAGMARRAREGKELMKIENGGNAIANQAKRKANPPPKPLGIKFMPASPFSVKINYQPAEVNFDVTTHRPRIQATYNQPELTYHPGQVETTVAVKNHLAISVKYE